MSSVDASPAAHRVHSIVTIALEAVGSKALLTLRHAAFPEEMRAYLNGEDADVG